MQPKKIVIGMLLKNIDDDGKRNLLQTKDNYTTSDQYVDFVLNHVDDICIIRPNTPPLQLAQIMSQINGILLPGGTSHIYMPDPNNKEAMVESDYTKGAINIINEAIKLNEKGVYFPLFGICLGFEALLAYAKNDQKLLKRYECNNYNTTLEFIMPKEKSKIMQCLGDKMIATLSTKPITYNYHSYYVDRESVESDPKLSALYNVVSESSSQDGKVKFISLFEGKKYPFYGVQFHPELNRVVYFKDDKEFSPVVSPETQEMSLLLTKFLVAEASKNDQKGDLYETFKKNPGTVCTVMGGYRFYTWK